MGRNGSTELDPHNLKNRDRAAHAVRLRIAGMTFDQIAEQLNYTSRGSAYRAIQNHVRWAMKNSPELEELRHMEVERLLALQRAWWTQAVGSRDAQGNVTPPDEKAAKIVISTITKRSDLQGLDLNQARMAGAMEISALADLARTMTLHGHLLAAMSEVGIDPDLQGLVIEKLNAKLGEASEETIEGEAEDADQ